jgi:hypothetical protein
MISIMYQKALIPLLFLGLAASSPALTDAGKAAGEELISALKEEAKSFKGKDKAAGEDDNKEYAVNQSIAQIQTAIKQGNNRQLERLQENRLAYLSSEKINRCLAKLDEVLKAEREQMADARSKDLEDLIKRAQDKVLQAKTPEELDGILGELTKIPSGEYDYENDQTNIRLRLLRQQFPHIKQFVTSWQDYLQAMQAGNLADAIQALKSLTGLESGLIPRSQILARLEQIKPKAGNPADIIDGIKNLDGMREALKSLAAAQQVSRHSDYSGSDISDLTQNLNSLEKTYREFLAGLPVNLDIFGRNYESSHRGGSANIVQLRADLIALVLPRYVGAPEETKAKPGENVQQLFNRMTAEAKARGDMLLCERIRQTQQIFTKGGNSMANDASGLLDYSAAQNQIGARQYMLAVVSLQKTLKGGSDMLPTQRIGQQLESIKNEHPKEYEEGMKEFLAPTLSSFPGLLHGGSMDPRMRAEFMNNNNQRGGGTVVVMPVPGKEGAAPANADDAKDPKSPEKKEEPKPTAPGKPAAE